MSFPGFSIVSYKISMVFSMGFSGVLSFLWFSRVLVGIFLGVFDRFHWPKRSFLKGKAATNTFKGPKMDHTKV